MNVIKFILIVLVLKLVSADFYVNFNSTCGSACDGSSEKPFTNIKSAINSIVSNQKKSTTINLYAGTYKGLQNVGVMITKPIQIKSISNQTVTIDCEKVGFAFSVVNVEDFSLSGVTIQNCSASMGGALRIENSKTSISKAKFLGNKAAFGGAIYSNSSVVMIYLSNFTGNVALESGSAIYSESSQFSILSKTEFNGNANNSKPTYISSKKSSVILDDAVIINNHITCDELSSTKYKSSSFCDSSSDTCSAIGIIPNIDSDKTIYTTGMLYKAYYNNNLTSEIKFQKIIPDNTIENFLNGHDGKVYGVLTGYLHMDNSMKVKFRFEGKNLGFTLKINGVKYLDVAQTANFDFPFEIYMVSKVSHQIQINLTSDTTGVGRSFKLYQISHDYRIFYTEQICGDGVQDDLDYCIEDSYDIFNSSNPLGDRVCGNENIHLNFQDCFNEISQNCEIPKKKDHISPLGNVGGMIGDLVENQYLWNVPGSEHFTYGMNVLSGQQSKAPVFQFDYCVEVANNILEDPYRMMAYEIPPSLNIKSLPICTYSSTTTMYNSFSEYQKEFQLEAGLSSSGDFKEELIDFKGGFSLDGSIETARDQSQSSTKNVFVTELNCKTSYIEMDDQRIRFHPMFLKDLATIEQESDLLKIFDKYGTYYYSSAYMGGKLVQISTTSESIDTDEKKKKWSIAAEATFGASINAPGFDGEGKATINAGMSSEEESLSEVQSKSTYSSIITYGGPPASFAPSDSFMSTTYQGWSSSIDLLPVPIGYKVKPIRDLLIKTWTIQLGSKNETVSALWNKMEKIYYQMNRVNPIPLPNDYKYSIIFDFESVNDLPRPITRYFMSMNWYDKGLFKNFYTTFQYVYYDTDGSETEFLFPNTYGANVSDPSVSVCTTNSATVSGSQKNSTICDTTIRSVPTKFRVDFYGPNFMNSSQAPNIYIEGLSNIGKSTLISWYTGEAIRLFRTTGNPNFLQWMPGNSARSLIQFEAARSALNVATGTSGDLGIYVGPNEYSRDNILNFGHNAGQNFNFYNRYTTDITLKTQANMPVSSFYAFHGPMTGLTQFRIDYHLYIVNNQAEQSWKSKVYYYHILEDRDNPSYMPLLANNYFFSLKPLTKDVPSKWFSFSNYNHPKLGGSGTVTDDFNFNSPKPEVEFWEFS
ncbi:hypothetical protein PPL_07811 [Heterostelium album PN500]|uniref:MACPF domain-containing protein n=1 Tax=Heterostelium pallidum (strain ATCC 26659 / Pp 5 / PN500) TaxID=670386 RepID=D3BH09_HETP5|nr:hypothetical protein PPL_07811 [Heterostelium album PN500]EFA79393.1 hypothetical protein PPL_07811 [Heterostelium album PN500]|eukprot:XP_020431514.1 hypothetical protein PPL_07811 [Heterostelium album PN500]